MDLQFLAIWAVRAVWKKFFNFAKLLRVVFLYFHRQTKKKDFLYIVASALQTYPEISLNEQCNLDLVTLNLVTTCDLVTIFQRPFFNLLHEIIRFSDTQPFILHLDF